MEFNAEVRKVTDPIYQKVYKTIPEIEWSIHAPYVYKINKLKKEKNAVILAHNYLLKILDLYLENRRQHLIWLD